MEKKAIQDQWPEYGTKCYGCGRDNKQGFQLKSYWDGDETVATWHPKSYHLAFPGTLCGGVIATLIDCHATKTANAAAYKVKGLFWSSLMCVSELVSNGITPWEPHHTQERPSKMRAEIKHSINDLRCKNKREILRMSYMSCEAGGKFPRSVTTWRGFQHFSLSPTSHTLIRNTSPFVKRFRSSAPKK